MLCNTVIPLTHVLFFDASFQNNGRHMLPSVAVYQIVILTFPTQFCIQNADFNSENSDFSSENETLNKKYF